MSEGEDGEDGMALCPNTFGTLAYHVCQNLRQYRRRGYGSSSYLSNQTVALLGRPTSVERYTPSANSWQSSQARSLS
jgi:hypothetical protein